METPAQTPEHLTPFGKYLLDAELARGGMARVYLARLRGLGGFEKKLVVKQILPELASDPRFVTMFVEEAKTLVQMTHPHIVPVYELGVVDGVYFLAMEHIEGATLSEILRDGPLPPEVAAHLGAQVCDALSYAHERYNLVHRDITPRNVIVDAVGHARLLDFGIAAQSEGVEEEHVFGSHGYMSPEQARGESVAARSDLFAVGAVLYEALTGEPAFLRDTTEETKRALYDEPLPVLGDGVPEKLAAIVHELLQRDPNARPQSAREVGERFRKFLAHARPEGAAPELGERADKARRLRGRSPSGRPPPASDRGSAKSVRTIATSIELQKLLTPSQLRVSVPIAAEDVPQSGTAKIPGRKKSNGEPAIAPKLDSIAEPIAETTAEPRTESRNEAPASRRYLGIVLALAAAVGGIVLLNQLSSVEPAADTRTHEVDSPPTMQEPAMRSDPDPTAMDVPSMLEPEPTMATIMAQEVATVMETAMVEVPPDLEGTGTLTISASPWAEIRVDGRMLGNQPVRAREVRAGTHRIAFRHPPTGAEASRTVNVPRGAHVVVRADMNARPPTVSVQ
jgi:serine/threonine-protein kinase